MKPHRHTQLRWTLGSMLVTVALFTSFSCAGRMEAQPFSAEQRVIGKSEQQLLICAGPPRTATSHDGVRVLTNQRESGLLEGSFPGSKSSRPEEVRHA